MGIGLTWEITYEQRRSRSFLASRRGELEYTAHTVHILQHDIDWNDTDASVRDAIDARRNQELRNMRLFCTKNRGDMPRDVKVELDMANARAVFSDADRSRVSPAGQKSRKTSYYGRRSRS